MRTSATRVIIFIIFGLLLFRPSTEGVGVSEYFPDERDALMQLRDIVNSSFNLHGNWTGPPCHKNHSRWAGIACLDWHVTHLVLEGIRLTGSLPPLFLQNITFLSKLSFRNNSLDGPLPDLTNLEHLEFVFLSQNHFSGSIPFDYVDLTKLTRLELQENDLTGKIPPFDQQSLVAFNVSHNQLGGQIPQTPVLARFSMSSYDNNSNLCGWPLGRPCPILPPVPSNAATPSPPPIPPRDNDNGALHPWTLGLIAAAAALVPLSVILIFLCYYRRIFGKETKNEQQGEASIDLIRRRFNRSESTDDPERRVVLEFFDKDKPAMFDLDDLLRASAQVIGKGKLGTTYKAMLECGSVVAVKRLEEMKDLAKKEFIQQMHFLGKMKHENLVEIISFYYSKEEKLIIYEYVPIDNLFTLLHENRGYERATILDWNARLSIIREIAKGVNFLHQYCLPSHKVVPHGNLKSSNILIQRENQIYRVKITDYGLSSLVLSRKSLEQLAVGKTPEFAQGKKLTRKADVYSFGIVLLEIITGKVPAQVDASADDLSDWVRSSVNNDWSTDILDVQIVAEREGYDGMLKLTELALHCTDMAPENRPPMTQVLTRIQAIEFQTKH
ncbi:putative leucine-rich repeat receptor-like protein kinase [Forsythia ovata]|uniref:Leucine-rich repeat receptor-like protein kinase n=1 Tax=Forsythia ovata TaxID=205694 RepID=A0ABD1QRN0_9LAMI